jgi:hypothetical protein
MHVNMLIKNRILCHCKAENCVFDHHPTCTVCNADITRVKERSARCTEITKIFQTSDGRVFLFFECFVA